jgi:hypothetical protein
VVAVTLVITGAGAVAEFTDTLSNVAVASVVVLPLFTASPTSTFAAMLIVWLAPSCTQVTPSNDVYALNVLPLRLTFTQYGKLTFTLPTCAVFPPVAVRKS